MTRGALLTAILVIVVSAASAQTPKARSSKAKTQDNGHMVLLTRTSPITLLAYEAVRKELELTDSQEAMRNQCGTKMKGVNEDLRKAREELRGIPDPERRALYFEQTQTAIDARRKQIETTMLKALDSRQRTRLDQIGIQMEGPRAFVRPEFQIRLNMSPGQIETIRAIVRQGTEASIQASRIPPEISRKAFLPPEPNRPPNVRKFDPKYRDEYFAAENKGVEDAHKASTAAERQIFKLLSKKQLQVYQALCGEPFDVVEAVLVKPTPPTANAAPKSESKADR